MDDDYKEENGKDDDDKGDNYKDDDSHQTDIEDDKPGHHLPVLHCASQRMLWIDKSIAELMIMMIMMKMILTMNMFLVTKCIGLKRQNGLERVSTQNPQFQHSLTIHVIATTKHHHTLQGQG